LPTNFWGPRWQNKQWDPRKLELKVGWTYAIATANTVGIRGHVQATGNQTANLQQYECYQALLLISNI